MTYRLALQQHIAALKPGAALDLDGAPFVVASNTQGVVEFYPQGHQDTTGSYRRVSHANVEALVNLGRMDVHGSVVPPVILGNCALGGPLEGPL